MSAFWKKDEKKDDKSEQKKPEVISGNKGENTNKKKAVSKKSKKSKKSDKKDVLAIPEESSVLINKVLIKPMISEAVMIAQELGKYTFKITKTATKKEVALAIEALYKVSVEKVNTVNYKAQTKFFRGKKGSSKGYRKAIVTLKKGDKIKLFS